MSQKAYTQRFQSAKLACAIDLSAGDWTSPPEGILFTNPQPTTSVYVGTAGTLTVVFASEPAVQITLANHPVGYADIGIIQVIKAGTTAGGLVALF